MDIAVRFVIPGMLFLNLAPVVAVSAAGLAIYLLSKGT